MPFKIQMYERNACKSGIYCSIIYRNHISDDWWAFYLERKKLHIFCINHFWAFEILNQFFISVDAFQKVSLNIAKTRIDEQTSNKKRLMNLSFFCFVLLKKIWCVWFAYSTKCVTRHTIIFFFFWNKLLRPNNHNKIKQN